MKKFLSFLFIITTLIYSEEKTIYHELAKQNLQAFKPYRDNWSSKTTLEFYERAFKHQTCPHDIGKRDNTFLIFKNLYERDNKPSSNVMTPSTWEDLNLFYGREDKKKFFADVIDRTTTEIGRVCFYKMLSDPTTDVSKLKRRQAIIKELISNEELFNSIDKALTTIKEHENLAISFWDDWKPFKNRIDHNEIQLKPFKWINDNEVALNIKSTKDLFDNTLLNVGTSVFAIGALCLYVALQYEEFKKYLPERVIRISDGAYQRFKSSVIPLSFITSYYVEKIKNIKPVIAVAAGAYIGLKFPYTIDWAHASFLLCQILQLKLISLANIVKPLELVYKELCGNTVTRDSIDNLNILSKFFEPSEKLSNKDKLIKLLKTKTYEKPSFFSNTGRSYLGFKLVYDCKDSLEGAFEILGEIDAYMSIAKIYKEFKNKRVHFAFANYVESDHPYINLEGFWNPFINDEKVVSNSIVVGGDQKLNFIITGPNAGGKSTVLKAVALNLIMAQSFGVAPSSHIMITPFKTISTYLNIVDDIAEGNSLFRAEVLRAQGIVESCKNLRPGEFSFLVMDEMFSGTTPKEGEASAYSVAKHIGNFDNSICMIATHFKLLTNLEKDTDRFINYKVSVDQVGDGSISYPFILSRGISYQHVAIDILKSEGFSGDVISTAENIMKQNS